MAFSLDEGYFLGYVVLSKRISTKSKRIWLVKKWSESKSVWDIQIFLGFANFYHQFIKGFSKIAASLMSMLKTTMSSQVLAANEVLNARMLATNEVGNVGSDNRSKHIKPEIGRSESQKLAKSRKSKKLSKVRIHLILTLWRPDQAF